MTKLKVIACFILGLGTAIWIYGYSFPTGNSSLVDWHAVSPWWIADFVRNMESEIGIALVFASIILLIWRARDGKVSHPEEVGAAIPTPDVGRSKKSDDLQAPIVDDLQSPVVDDFQSPVVNVMEVVREMIWNDPHVRQEYEAMRADGISEDDVVTEIAKAYVECQWSSRGRLTGWPDVLREKRERHFGLGDDLLASLAATSRRES